MSTQLIDDRDTALAVGYVATDCAEAFSFADYRATLQDWRVRALLQDGQVIGAVYSRGDEIHVSVLPDWRKRWATKGVLKQLFAGARVTTTVVPGHEYMYDILARLGFVQLPDGQFVKGH